MRVQINLLPDVKHDYLKSQQSKHAFLIGSVLVSAVCIALLALLFTYVSVVQPRHLTNLSSDVENGLAQTKEVPKGVEMVTVQGALEQLPGLQDKKQITSRLFGYIKNFTPRDVSYAEITLDLSANTLSLRGETTNYEQTNVLANNLKSAELTFVENDTTSTIKPFSQVVFTNLGRAEQAENGRSVSFQVDMVIDPTLFRESIEKPTLKVNADSKELLIPTAKPFASEGGGNE